MANRGRKRAIRFFVLCLLAAIPAQAAGNVAKEAQEALTAGKPQDAYELLLPVYQQGGYDNQSLFLLAMSAKQLGNWAECEKYLSELLERDPGAARVKLELAEVHYRNGNPVKAKALLYEVKAANPPPKVGENIDAFLAFIDQGTPKAWNAYASLGFMYDTNANQGPSIDSVLMYGLPFTLDGDAKDNHDWAAVLKAGADYTHALKDGWALQAGGSVNLTDYHELNKFDALSVSLSAGPSWQARQWFFSVPYILNVVKIGHDQEYYSVSNGLAPQFGYQVSPQFLIQGSLAYQEKHYKNNSPRDGESITMSPSARYSLDNTSYFSIGGYIGKENSGIETSSNDSRGLNLGYYKAFSKQWSVYASPAYSRTDYKGVEAAYGTSREDKQLSMTANLNYLIEPWGANVTFSFTHTDNDSSIVMYEYERQQTMLSIAKNF